MISVRGRNNYATHKINMASSFSRNILFCNLFHLFSDNHFSKCFLGRNTFTNMPNPRKNPCPRKKIQFPRLILAVQQLQKNLQHKRECRSFVKSWMFRNNFLILELKKMPRIKRRKAESIWGNLIQIFWASSLTVYWSQVNFLVEEIQNKLLTSPMIDTFRRNARWRSSQMYTVWCICIEFK